VPNSSILPCISQSRCSRSSLVQFFQVIGAVPVPFGCSNRLAALYHVLQNAVYLRNNIGRQSHPSSLGVVFNLFGA
jgi:hypothetical protein